MRTYCPIFAMLPTADHNVVKKNEQIRIVIITNLKLKL